MSSQDEQQNESVPESGEASRRPGGISAVISHMSNNKVEAFLWATRMATLFFTIGYFLPLFGNPYQAYNKALIANAATSALRLHQRLPRVQFSREFLAVLLLEDSCHYLFYTIIFLYAAPMTIVLLPISLFALLHSANYSLYVFELMGWGSTFVPARMLNSLIEFHSQNILRMVAFTEIVIMPFAIFMLFAGKSSLITPFIYYRFLTLRYSSRRNPYSRTVFHELKLSVELAVNKPACPAPIRNLAFKAMGLIARLAPPVAPSAQ